MSILAYPAGALSDRMSPRTILMAGIAVLIAGNLVLAETGGFAGLVLGAILWGAHMALTQGIFSRMIADSAPAEHARDELRRLLFRQRHRRLACKPRRRLAVGPRGRVGDLPHQRGNRRRGLGDAEPAGGGSWWSVIASVAKQSTTEPLDCRVAFGSSQ